MRAPPAASPRASSRRREPVAGRRPQLGQDGERRARVGERVDADAIPGHAVAAGDADQAEEQHDGDARHLEAGQQEVGDHDGADEDLEDEQELALLHEVGLAGLVDQLRDVGHRLVHRQVLQVRIHREPKQEAQ